MKKYLFSFAIGLSFHTAYGSRTINHPTCRVFITDEAPTGFWYKGLRESAIRSLTERGYAVSVVSDLNDAKNREENLWLKINKNSRVLSMRTMQLNLIQFSGPGLLEEEILAAPTGTALFDFTWIASSCAAIKNLPQCAQVK